MQIDSGLAPSTQYFYRAVAVNNGGATDGTPAAATTPATTPPPPTVLCMQGSRAVLEAQGYTILDGPFDTLDACEITL